MRLVSLTFCRNTGPLYKDFIFKPGVRLPAQPRRYCRKDWTRFPSRNTFVIYSMKKQEEAINCMRLGQVELVADQYLLSTLSSPCFGVKLFTYNYGHGALRYDLNPEPASLNKKTHNSTCLVSSGL